MAPAGTNPGNSGGEGCARPFLRAAELIIKALDLSGQIIAAVTLAFTFLTLLVNVILRYAFDSGIAWAYEIHAVLLPWLVAGGIVVAAARSRHISVTLLPDLLGPRGLGALLLAVNAVIVIISVNVLWTSQPILRASQFQTLSTLGIRQIWGYSSLVYAFAAMTVIALLNMVLVLAGRLTHDMDPSRSSLS